MKKGKGLLFCIIVLCISQNLFGQTETVRQSPYELTDQQKRELASIKGGLGKDSSGMMKQPTETPAKYGSIEERQKRNEEFKKRQEEALKDVEEINRGLKPPPEYLQKYSQYNRGEKGGILRLFPEKIVAKEK